MLFSIKKVKKLLVGLIVISLYTGFTYAGKASKQLAGGDTDPLVSLNYRKAFDQKEVYKEFSDLLEELGCSENIFDGTSHMGTVGQIIEPLDENDQPKKAQLLLVRGKEQQEQRIKDFHNACLRKLHRERQWALVKPARDSATVLIMLILATTTAVKLLDADSLVVVMSIFKVLFSAVMLLPDIVRSGYDLMSEPIHPLDNLEKQFAQNQYCIPRQLWPIIIEKFVAARQNVAQQRNSMNFLEFTLGLTTYKILPVVVNDTITVQMVYDRICKNIDQFFDQYEDQEIDHSKNRYRMILKCSVYKFITALIGNKKDTKLSPGYLYLYGIGGIGKTYFVSKLSEWLQEFIPQGVHYEDIVITTAQELEGDSKRPGALLCALRNQMVHKKRGSVVFMDEATWLNSSNMISPAKRVFNGDQTKLSTTYFGESFDGSALSLAIPPMLIIVASNEKIKDPALESRFDIVDYPKPKLQTLITCALDKATKSPLLKALRVGKTDQEVTVELTSKITSWIEEEKIDNFRAITSYLEPVLLTK